METAGEILKAILREISVQEGDGYVSLFQKWESFAGESLAAHSRIADVRNGFLVITMDHPGWYQTFQFQEAAILHRIKKAYPELNIRGVKVKVEPPAKAPQKRADEERIAGEEFQHLIDELRMAVTGRKEASRDKDGRKDVP